MHTHMHSCICVYIFMACLLKLRKYNQRWKKYPQPAYFCMMITSHIYVHALQHTYTYPMHTKIKYTCYTGESLVFNDNKRVKLYLKIIISYFFVPLKRIICKLKKSAKMLKGFKCKIKPHLFQN